jgi:histidinol phosphatase-like enzyme
MINKEIIIWDNDGTITGSQNPHDTTDKAKVILPNVKQVMNASKAVHIICSGCKTPESELQNFDPENVIKRFKALMEQLPVQVAVFSPAIGGTECYVVIKKTDSDDIIVHKAHEDIRYRHLIGQFKKPGVGMLVVIRDILDTEFGITMNADSAIMIGDTWHDEYAASAMGIQFVDASRIHTMKKI